MTGNPNRQLDAGRRRSGQGSQIGLSSVPEDRERTAFGLDLGGYSAGGSALVCATRRIPTEVQITVYRGHAFSKKPGRGTPLAPIVEKEVELLAACLRRAPLYADVPIDLQGLPCPGGEVYAWQLVKRPVDFAFGALPPLADRIGAVVARFRNILRSLPSDWGEPLGSRLYEAYPAASLRLLGLPHKGYKDEGKTILFEDGGWVGSGPRGKVLAGIARELGMTADPGGRLNHDEFDAVLCALAGLVDPACLCQGEDLKAVISREVAYERIDSSPPRGYVLVRRMPKATRIAVRTKTVRDHAEMLEEVSGK